MSASTLGRDTPQVTARSKVLGRAVYAGDIQLPGMLHGKVLRSPYPRARIVASRARTSTRSRPISTPRSRASRSAALRAFPAPSPSSATAPRSCPSSWTRSAK